MNFLHISDLHYKLGYKNEVNFNLYKNQLFEKLNEERNKIPFDFICFSGDLVYGGSKAEYEEFYSEFFTPLLKSIDLPMTACCFTPGNHDQEWGQLEVFSSESLLNCKTNEEFNTLLSKDIVRESLLNSFSAYKDFVNSVNPPFEGRSDLSCYWLMDFNNLRVKITSLNSSILSKFYYPDGGYGKMRLSESQILTFLKPDSDTDIQLTMSHYPIDYLLSTEKILFEDQLMKVGGLYLHGHIHEMSHLKIFNKNYENGSLLYCPVGPLFTKKEEIGRFANAFNRILINKEGNVELKSYIYSSLPNPRWMANQYTGKDNGIHNFQLKKVNPHSTGSGEKSNEISQEFRHDSIEDIIRLNPFLSSLDRSVEKKILEESLGIDNFINQYEIIAKEIGEKMYESNDNELKLLRVLAYQTGKLFLYSFLTNKIHIYPSIQYSYFVETLSNLGSDKIDYNKLSESFSFLHSNLDFQDPFFEYPGDDEAKMAYECFPFFILALSIISFHDQGEFISRILGIEEAEEEVWESTVRKTTYNSFEKSLNLLVSARSKSSFVIVSLVKSVISKIITEGDDSFKRHNLSSPIISININFDSPPSGFREINFSADVPKLTALVMGRELYGDNANVIFIRELIQNSIDAIRARLRLDSKDFNPLIKISFSEQNNSFIVEDNGVGMSKIEAESYLLKVGRSIWRSKRLNKENETTPDSIGRFGIGFVSALYVSKLIRVTTLRYTLNSQAFNLVIRSVDKPVYVDEKIERKNIGTRIEVQLFDPISLNDFNSTLKNFFLFHPDGITFDYPMIPKTAKESLIESFTEDLETDFSKDYLLGKEIYTIKANDSELNFVVPALESLDKWKVSAPSQYKITNGCVFVSSGSIRSYSTIIPSMKLLNKGLFILSLKEGKFNISAKRSELEIPDIIIKGLDAPLNREINRLYIELLNKYSNVNNFFYGNLWTGLKSIFDEAIIKHNSQLLNNFELDLTFEGEDPKSFTLEKINSLTGYQFLDFRSNVFGSLYYQIYKSLKPKSNFVLIRASNRDNLLRQLINHKISSMSNTDFRTKIYNESLIPELQGHPLYNVITKYISVADNNFFKDNNLAGLFFRLSAHPVIEKIGMKRDKNRRNTRPTTFINSNHPWAISMSKISGLNLTEEKLLNIEKVIYWVLRSQGSEKIKYQNQLAKIPVDLGLESAPIEIE